MGKRHLEESSSPNIHHDTLVLVMWWAAEESAALRPMCSHPCLNIREGTSLKEKPHSYQDAEPCKDLHFMPSTHSARVPKIIAMHLHRQTAKDF